MKIKTSDLIGPALDWAVCKALGKDVYLADYGTLIPWTEKVLPSIIGMRGPARPSTDWAQGGPIIYRESIGFFQKKDEGYCQAAKPGAEFVQRGSTPLIASMRCYVASKLGDEVEIPDELGATA